MADTLPATRDESPKLSAKLEQALVEGDLKGLTTAERVEFYNATCQSLRLNPLTKPFGYIVLNGKLTLYALKACTDQLRETRGVSITSLREEPDGDVYKVWADARDAAGRTDADMGAVSIKGLSGDALCNAKMRAITKAKRRVTLSICGLGMLDETEVLTIPGARTVREDEPVAPPIARPRRLPTNKYGREGPPTPLEIADELASRPPAPHPYDSNCECGACMKERDRREVPPKMTPEENAKLDRELAAEVDDKMHEIRDRVVSKIEQPPLFGEDMASEMRNSGERSGPFISQPQVARLMAIAKAAGETEAGVMARLENQYGITHRNKIPRVLYEAIVAGFERKSHPRIVRR